MSAVLKQLLTFLFSWYSTIQSTVYKRIVFVPMDYQLYISGTVLLLHIKCILSQWMHVLSRRKETGAVHVAA